MNLANPLPFALCFIYILFFPFGSADGADFQGLPFYSSARPSRTESTSIYLKHICIKDSLVSQASVNAQLGNYVSLVKSSLTYVGNNDTLYQPLDKT